MIPSRSRHNRRQRPRCRRRRRRVAGEPATPRPSGRERRAGDPRAPRTRTRDGTAGLARVGGGSRANLGNGGGGEARAGAAARDVVEHDGDADVCRRARQATVPASAGPVSAPGLQCDKPHSCLLSYSNRRVSIRSARTIYCGGHHRQSP